MLGILIIITVHLFPLIQNVHGWRNGQNIDEFSSDPSNPNYGTHDWIAEHALDWLPENEKRYIVDNLASYLYGTELPDKTTGDNAIGDKDLHHYYFNENGDVMDNIAGIRAAQQYYNAVKKLEKGDLKNGTMRLGSMTHYISDLSVFGNVMSETYWGTAGNYSNYMSYVNSKMASYTSAEFDGYLNFDGRLALIEPDDAANAVAFNTTFDNNTIEARVQTGGKENCSWMEANYDWGDPVFKDRCGESLNYAVNLIADVLHSIYVQNLTPPSPPKNLAVSSVTGHSVNLTWKANPEDTLAGYSIYINKTDSSTQFYPTPINISRESTTYPYTGLIDEVKYYFKIVAFNMFDKTSGDSNIVSATTLDVTPPPVPSLANLPEITRKSVISISGISPEHGSLIEIYLNNDFSAPAYTNYSDPISGIYRVEIELVLGVNNITVRAVDDTGNPSAFSKSQLVIYDSIPPVADAGLNIELGMGKDPVVVVFNGSGSTDNLGILINYTWTLEIQYKYYYLYDKNPTFIFNKPDDYRIWLNVTDMAGNYDTDYFWVNVSQLDINRPYMTSQTPNIDETNVSVNITIRVKFNEPLNISTIKLTLKSNIDGEIQIPRPGYDPLGDLILKPFTNLSFGRIYTVTIKAKDLNGNGLVGGSWNFSTEPRPLDFDGDNIPDNWEWKYNLDANRSDAHEDPDDDGLTNFEEYNNGHNSTNPRNVDTDGDDMSDYFEFIFSLSPLNPTDRDLDLDDDGKTNYEEFLGPDGNPDTKDWTDPNHKPEPEPKGKEKTEEDFTLLAVGIILIIVILMILFIVARKMRYKESGIKKVGDDDYLKTEDPDELGVGGKILFENHQNYKKGKDDSEPETKRSLEVGKSIRKEPTEGDDKSDKPPTPEEILARAKRDEKKCPKCGAGLPMDTSYCFECGSMLEENSK